MGKKLACLCLALGFALLAAGCNPFATQNIDDLLRAPALGQGQGEVQKALANYLGEEPQYIYPKEGGRASPLTLADLDGDGIEEGVLLYSVANSATWNNTKGSNVYVAVLEYTGEGWQVVQDVPGNFSDVASCEAANLLGDGTLQLVVGFATPGFTSKALVLYQYADGVLTKILERNYSHYAIDDFTGRGGSDLLVVSAEDNPGGLQLQYIPTQDGVFVELPEAVNLSTDFKSCVGLYPSRTPEEDRLVVVVDGELQNNGMLASQFVDYSAGRFYAMPDVTALVSETARYSGLLRSRDIDGDGIVEIPQEIKDIGTFENDKQLKYIEWVNFTGSEPESRQFGMLDADRGIYIRFPAEWRDTVIVTDGGQKGEWVVRNRDSNQRLLALREVGSDEAPPPGSMHVSGTAGTYLVFGDKLPALQRNVIQVVALG